MQSRRRAHIRLFLSLAMLIAAPALIASCDDGSSSTEPDAPLDTLLPDGASDDIPPTSDGAGPDLAGDGTSDAMSDGDQGDDGDAVVVPLPELLTKAPVASPPLDPLAGTALESCPVYREEVCDGGTLRRCNVYDVAGGAFTTTPDPLLHRTLLFDRWHDLYHNPTGLTSEIEFAGEVLPGTPEAVWGDPANFSRYTALGDSAIWNGAALLGHTMRYLNTGTESDYQRMEQKLKDMLLQFDITGIDGYLARHHFMLLEDGAPKDPNYAFFYGDMASLDHRKRPVDAAGLAADGVPQVYLDGAYVDAQGQSWPGTPMYNANPSIDQYSGPRTTFPLVYHLLRDDDLKARIVNHMTCYIKRLERIEIVNVNESPEVAEALQNFLQEGDAQLDPDDIDLSEAPTIVMYVLRNLNSLNEDDFDRTCPEEIQMTPWRTLDASSGTFLLELAGLASDLDSRNQEREKGVDHFYVPNVRGDDAVHMMHLAAIGYHLTGDDMYRRFLFEELIGNLGALDVAYTAGAFDFPIWCRKFYGHHIAFTPTWAFLTLLDESDLLDHMRQIYEEEYWQKEMAGQANAKFNIMYAGELSDDVASARTQAIAQAVNAIETMGGNGGILDDPRRSYNKPRDEVIALFPGWGNAERCPTAEEFGTCEDPIDVLGLQLPGIDITEPCTGAAGECIMSNGECAPAMARDPLPMEYRNYTGFLWQRSPFEFGKVFPIEGQRQNAAHDVTEEYWLARHYGFVTDGESQVLAWEELGACQ